MFSFRSQVREIEQQNFSAIWLRDIPLFDPRTPMNGGFILKTGRLGLIELLEEWRTVGVNHAALGIQYGKRPPKEVIQEIGEEVIPAFI
ncbi:hypothetical protein LGZ99_11825 [Photorhabdus temperata]|uniref:Luciferase-like domain-containing protein n=1 Tax=Photorhabdus temperata subsp. temperata Meg1 TaxID=1393735 RepID=A0A081RWS8_PHOTE|nr:hypothetical protein [Photorhabdus temperata]KER03131.1 hypothetical protein MEG1DRAFT_02267 [Photorhabdus temperata subsp. temperata Meg1]MCT8347877.1 hypothetical protein [Photorhabdus temperata]